MSDFTPLPDPEFDPQTKTFRVSDASTEAATVADDDGSATIRAVRTTEVIPDKEWDKWLDDLTVMLMKYTKVFKVVDFIQELTKQVEQCSRFYTMLWAMETLRDASKRYKSTNPTIAKDVEDIQRSVNELSAKYGEKRKQLLGIQCIDYFVKNYPNYPLIITLEEIQQLKMPPHAKWLEISKRCHDHKLHETPEYKAFIEKLVTEMVKY